MNSDYEKRLETEIDGVLKGLPDLRAPESLARRVMSKTIRRAQVPWYHRSWELWPAGLRFAALAVLLAGFGGVCFASWQLTRAAGFAAAMQEVSQLFSGVTVIWNALKAVMSGLLLALRQLHPAILVGCIVLIGLAWSVCVGLGTAFIRLAVVRR